MSEFQQLPGPCYTNTELTRTLYTSIPIPLLVAAAKSKGTIIVFLWLWHYAGRDDRAFPAVDRLAADCQMHPDGVRRSLRWLTENQWAVRIDRPGKTSLYHVRSEIFRQPEGPDHPCPEGGVHPVDPSINRGPLIQGVPQTRTPHLRETNNRSRNKSLDNLQVLETQNQKPKPQEPPSKAPQGAVLPPVARLGRPDVDGWKGGQPTAARGPQQPQEAASTASSGSPYRQAPQDGLPGPQSSQFQSEVPAEQPKPRAKAPTKPRDPYASRDLPESAIPDDLLGVQQLMREWWGLKPRGRTEAAFNRACSLLRRYSRSEQEQILEKAVIGGHQGLYEPAPTSARGLRSGGRSSAPSIEERCKAVSELLHNGIFPFQRNQSQLTEQ